MKKRSFTAEYKSRIVLEVLREEKTLSEIAGREQLSLTQLSGWKREFLNNTAKIFGVGKDEKELSEQLKAEKEKTKELMQKVGQLTLEADWLKKKSAQLLGDDWEIKSGFKR